jgi:hypothetical protein
MLAVGLAAPWLGGVSKAAAVPPTATTWVYPVGSHTYVVPPGVTRVLVDASGAAGGSSVYFPASSGGKGGRVVAVVLVTPGETLTVNVGGWGTSSGGSNGGARSNGSTGGFGGGGATDLRRGSSLSDRLVVAGGGGGAGVGSNGGSGGHGGGTAGAPGMPSGPTLFMGGGGPGTVAAGGVGGANAQTNCECFGLDGENGSFGQGGAGGGGSHWGGGGGGGGWYGGGGGASGSYITNGTAGGGGGSSYVAPVGAIPVAMSTGLQYGDGAMSITSDLTADDAPSVSLVSPADAKVFAVGEAQVFTVSATDLEGDQWVGRIEIRDSAGAPTVLFTTPASSGQTVGATPAGRLPPGNYTWTAAAVDARGAVSAPAPTRAFSVVEQPFLGTGALVFKGTASLPTFPCPPPPPYGTGPCGGSFTGDWTGNMAGTDGRSTYNVAWAAPAGRLNASFQYAEWQCAGTETVLGLAIGTGTADALPGEVQGKWQVPGESFPRDIIRVTAAFTFNWVRVGTSAVLVLQPVNLTAEVAGLGPQTIVNTTQAGVAAFVATHSSSPGGVPSCAQPLTGVDGTIAGTVPLIQAST